MKRPRGLGRGLDALLGERESEESTLKQVPLASLIPGKFQPRVRMDEESLSALAQSIKANGVVQPIVVRPLNSDKYEIIAGERRFRAANLAGLSEIPAVVRDAGDDSALALALIENIQREDLNPLEEAAGIQRLIDEFQMTHQQAADAVGRSRAAVTNLLRLLQLTPAAQEMLLEGRIEMGHARALLALDQTKQEEMAAVIEKRGLSVRETEALVRKWLAPAEAPAKEKSPDRDVLRLQEELSERLGTTVVVKHGSKNAGKLVIHYANLDELDSILKRLA